MLSIRNLTYRIAGRPLFDKANAEIADGWKVGLVGRNGTGKSTLLRLIRESLVEPSEDIRIRSGATVGWVAQEVEPSERLLLDEVLSMDAERAGLWAELDHPDTPPERFSAIHERLGALGAYSDEARASEILTGLGFSHDDLSRPCSAFSGGWRMRAALGGVLFSEPDLLLLDEPTNYLDLEGAAWLEKRLQIYPNTILLVSHDRELLNRGVDHILALDHLQLSVHTGGYDTYVEKRAARYAELASKAAQQDRERDRLQAFVDRFKAKASKARQAQSRVKALEKMQRIDIPLAERTHPFSFPEVEELASPIFEIEAADLGYASGRPVLADVNLRIDQDDRVAIIGANGQGKSTLVKSIAGRIALLTGERRAHRRLRIGYFSQDQLDELDANETPLAHVQTVMGDMPEAKRRAIVAAMGFDRSRAETPAGSLSGGEKVRLMLGIAALQKPHILILDEPTSHLDIDSREALAVALNEYDGAVLLITHDVALAEACAERLWLVNNGHARPYEGDLTAYRRLVLDADRRSVASNLAAPAKPAAPPTPPPPPAPKAPAKVSSPEARRQKAEIRKRISAAEAIMTRCKADIDRIDAKLASPGSTSKDELAALMKERHALQAKLDAAEETWLAASEEHDAVE